MKEKADYQPQDLRLNSNPRRNDKRLRMTSLKPILVLTLIGAAALGLQGCHSKSLNNIQGGPLRNRVLQGDSSNGSSSSSQKQNCMTAEEYRQQFLAQWQQIQNEMRPLQGGGQINVIDVRRNESEFLPVIPSPRPIPSQTPGEIPTNAEGEIIPIIPPTAQTVAPPAPTETEAQPTDQPLTPPGPTEEVPVTPSIPTHSMPTEGPTEEPITPPTPSQDESLTPEPTPSQEESLTPEPTPSQEESPTPEPTPAELPLGCVEVLDNNECVRCNQYSWLDTNDNSCNCVFNYKVEIEKHCDENPKSSQEMTYELAIYTHLSFVESLYASQVNGTLNCSDALLFIFADMETLDMLSLDVDQLTCSLTQIFYILPPMGNNSYSNILRVRNLNDRVFDAFIQGQLEMAFDYSVINLECYGAPDFLVNYQGIQCGPEQQDYCRYQNQTVNETIPSGNETVIDNTTEPIDNNTSIDNTTGDNNETIDNTTDDTSNEINIENNTSTNETTNDQNQTIETLSVGYSFGSWSGNGRHIQGLGSNQSEVCNNTYNLSLTFDQNTSTWGLNITNLLPFVYTGDYINETTGQVRCEDIIYAAQNLSVATGDQVGYSSIKNCYVSQVPASSSGNASNAGNQSNATSNESSTSNDSVIPVPTTTEAVVIQPTLEPTPVPNVTESSITPENPPTSSDVVPNNNESDNGNNTNGNNTPIIPPPQNLSSSQGFSIVISNMSRDEIGAFANQLYILYLNLTNLNSSDLSCNFQGPYPIQGGPSEYPSKCSNSCASCDDETGMCDLCIPSYLLVPTGIDSNTCILNPCNTSTQIYDFRTQQCRTKCSVGCAQCSQNGQCQQCDVDYFKLYNNYNRIRNVNKPTSGFKCVKQCPVDFFTDYRQRECSLCDPECPQCEQSMFYRCPFDATLYASCDEKRPLVSNQISGQLDRLVGKVNCQKRCPEGYYGFNAWCHKCSSQCKSCLSFYQCLSCPDYSRLVNNTCVSEVCQAGQYLNRQGRCANCSSNCTECSLSANNCTACEVGFSVSSNGRCLENQTLEAPSTCKSGFYPSLITNQCEACSQNCFQCSNSSNCTQCSQFSYSLYNQTTQTTSCVTFCPLGFYSSNAGRQCIPCSTRNCKVCAPQATCWTCNPGFYKSRTQCFNTCPVGQYIGQDFLKYYQCQTCPASCVNCSSRDTCSQCAEGYIKVASQYPDIEETQVQKTLGVTCVRNGSQCPNGTWFNQNANECRLCPRGCAQCDSQGQCVVQCDLSTQSKCQDCLSKPLDCLQCKPGEILIQGQGDQPSRCQPNCSQSGQFYDNATQTCQSCLANCSQCSNQNTCQKCVNNTYLQMFNDSQSCVEQCQTGYYGQNSSQQCKKCPKNCVNCSQGNRCDVCDATTQLDPLSGRCYCALKYTAYLSSASQNVQVELQNIQWDVSVIDNFVNPGTYFNCSEIFNFDLANQTSSQNANINDTLDDFDNLQCSGAIAPDGNYASVTIYNVSQVMQSLIRLQLVQIGLVKGSYHISCVEFRPPSLSIQYEGDENSMSANSGSRRLQLSELQSASSVNLFEDEDVLKDIDEALQEQGDQLKQLIDQQEQEDKFYKDVLKSQEHQEHQQQEIHNRIKHLNVVIIIGVLLIVGLLLARKVMKNNKLRMIVYERQKSDLEDEDKVVVMDKDEKCIEMGKLKEKQNDQKELLK
eukprot:403357748